MTDTNDQPLNINEGIKLELGSTAKLRTLVTYLEIVGELHEQLAGRTVQDLEALDIYPLDPLSRWAILYLAEATDRSLPAMLDAAMERTYSANPGESFFTGGGLHTFSNFKPEDNDKTMTVREALRQSVNLVFIRVMRDVVRYFIVQRHESTWGPRNAGAPDRKEYLAKFADTEGQKYLSRFYGKYKGKSADEALKTLVGGIVPAPVRLAVIYRSIMPQNGLKEFSAFVKSNLPSSELSGQTLSRLLQQICRQLLFACRSRVPGPCSPAGALDRCLSAGPSRSNAGRSRPRQRKERQQVYTWLFKTRDKAAQDSRIQIVMETEAFQEIHRMWKRLGYPFDSLVPSYATAIGSSADRPAALAELVGICEQTASMLPACASIKCTLPPARPMKPFWARAQPGRTGHEARGGPGRPQGTARRGRTRHGNAHRQSFHAARRDPD